MKRKKEGKKERHAPEANEKMKNELLQVGFEPTTRTISAHQLSIFKHKYLLYILQLHVHVEMYIAIYCIDVLLGIGEPQSHYQMSYMYKYMYMAIYCMNVCKCTSMCINIRRWRTSQSHYQMRYM